MDWDLLQLPLEALNLLQSENIKAVARDFSLQMLCHRFVVEDEGKMCIKNVEKRA